MKCECFLYEEDEDASEGSDVGICACGHAEDEHAPALGGHPGECTIAL